jgi:predicted phage gp36 major capsid-like protein
LCLKNYPYLTAHSGWLSGRVPAHNQRPSGAGNHESGENPEKRGLATAVGAEQAEEFGRSNVKRNVIKRRTAVVTMDDVLDRDYGLGVRFRFGANFLVGGQF